MFLAMPPLFVRSARRRMAVFSGGLVVAASFLAGCAPDTRLCRPAAGECGDQRACVAGRCTVDTASHTPAAAAILQRWTAPANAQRVVGRAETTALRLGGAGGADAVLFSFPSPPQNAEIVEAFLLVPRDDSALPGDGAVSLRADVPDERWIGLEATHPAPRTLGIDAPQTLASGSGARLLRIDVSQALRRQKSSPNAEIALVAEASGRRGVPVRLDLFGGAEAGARLDVYYRLRETPSVDSPLKNGAAPSSNADPAPQPFAPY